MDPLELYLMLLDNDVAMLRTALQKDGTLINARIYDDLTPLQFLCQQGGSLEVCQELLAHQADVNEAGRWDQPPLLLAVSHERLELVQLLLQFGANVNVIGYESDERSPLREAKGGEMTRLLVTHGADIKIKNGSGETPLLEAVEYGDSEKVKVLVEHGADIHATGSDGWACIHVAVTDLEVMKYLLEHGADVHARTRNGETPLHKSVNGNYTGRKQAVMLLIDYGADVHAREETRGLSVLHRACERDDVSVVEVLFEQGVDINARDNQGWTPLLWACRFHNWEVVRKLVQYGAFVNDRADEDATDGYGISQARTPLSMACTRSEVQVMQMLLDAGACVDYRDKGGSTALLHAVEGNRFECARLLLQRGADIHAQIPTKNTTPFLLACEQGRLGWIYIMIRFCAHHKRPQLASTGSNVV